MLRWTGGNSGEDDVRSPSRSAGRCEDGNRQVQRNVTGSFQWRHMEMRAILIWRPMGHTEKFCVVDAVNGLNLRLQMGCIEEF
mmetsp:Transcript_106655/g.168523  ORF Transcript_106655/g.168523 Transcript_106655/m.168523 type:complete len:83 (-) Transcript_106655:78-326(-)